MYLLRARIDFSGARGSRGLLLQKPWDFESSGTCDDARGVGETPTRQPAILSTLLRTRMPALRHRESPRKRLTDASRGRNGFDPKCPGMNSIAEMGRWTGGNGGWVGGGPRNAWGRTGTIRMGTFAKPRRVRQPGLGCYEIRTRFCFLSWRRARGC